jgi:hypothetical protein
MTIMMKITMTMKIVTMAMKTITMTMKIITMMQDAAVDCPYIWRYSFLIIIQVAFRKKTLFTISIRQFFVSYYTFWQHINAINHVQ